MIPTSLRAAAAATLLVTAGLTQNPTNEPTPTPASRAPDGFLTGLTGFEDFHEPIGQPLYFESPFNDTGLRFLYLRHNFDRDSVLQGGNVTVYALQARLALTERLALIATKDGYSELETGLLGEDEGWNDIAAGLKYSLLVDRDNDRVVTAGLRYQAENGHRGILQGGVDEFSPFVSGAQGFGRAHVIGGMTLRVPTDRNDGNVVGHWDLHFDYDVNPGAQAVLAPTLEVHGVHYLDDGALAVPVGGLDYTNLGSQPKESFVSWASIGTRLEIIQKYELGFLYEFALTDSADDIMRDRFTIDFFVRW